MNNILNLILMTNKLIKTMAISSAMSVMLVFFRIQWSGSLLYIFLIWNLFLAWVPFLFSLALTEFSKRSKSKIKMLSLFCGWLVFFPNSPYILTDLFHLSIGKAVPMWFDLVFILSMMRKGFLFSICYLLFIF